MGSLANNLINPQIMNSILENTSEGICLITPTGDIAYVNPGFAKMIGYEREQLLGKKITELLDDNCRISFTAKQKLREQGKLNDNYELIYKNPKSGKLVTTLVAVNPIFDDKGQLLYSMGIHTDTSELRKVQHDLAQNLGRISQAQKRARIGFWEFDVRAQSYKWSHEMLHLLGFEAPHAPPTVENIREMIHLDDRAKWAQARQLATEKGIPYTVPIRFLHPKNGLMHLILGGEAEFGPDGKVIMIYGILIDETKKAEQEHLIESQREKMLASAKLSALGEMAGGVAHEINNPLTIIKLRIAQIISRLKNNKLEPIHLEKSLSQIEETVDRIDKIVKGLKVIGRDGSADPFNITSLSQLIDQSVALCGERFRSHGIKLEIADIPDLNLSIRIVEISQILLNLFNNAHDAIENLSDRWIRLQFTKNNNFVEIRVINSGEIIPGHLQEKIFQPFFTTKDVGKGTGLGLSISKAIAEAHHGKLDLDTSKGHTEFVLTLPLQQKTEAS